MSDTNYLQLLNKIIPTILKNINIKYNYYVKGGRAVSYYLEQNENTFSDWDIDVVEEKFQDNDVWIDKNIELSDILYKKYINLEDFKDKLYNKLKILNKNIVVEKQSAFDMSYIHTINKIISKKKLGYRFSINNKDLLDIFVSDKKINNKDIYKYNKINYLCIEELIKDLIQTKKDKQIYYELYNIDNKLGKTKKYLQLLSNK